MASVATLMKMTTNVKTEVIETTIFFISLARHWRGESAVHLMVTNSRERTKALFRTEVASSRGGRDDFPRRRPYHSW